MLSDDELRRYRHDGFLVVRGVFAPSEVEGMRAAFDRLAETAATLPGTTLHDGAQFVITPGDPVRIHRVVWCGGAEPVLSDFGRDPRLLRLAGQLLDADEVEQLINQAHFKRPGDEVGFPWHQDSVHRRHGTPEWTDLDGRGSFVELATALDPMGEDNGPLRFVPGSHLRGHLSLPDGSLPADRFDPADAVSPTLEPGDVVAFGPFVIHGSEPNRATRPRRLFLNGFALPGANRRVYPGAEAGRRLPVPRAIRT